MLGDLAALYGEEADEPGAASAEEDAAGEPPPKRGRTSAPSELRSHPPIATLPPPFDAPTAELPSPPLDPPMGGREVASDGRVRQFEHVDGQYATHVYLPVAPPPPLERAVGTAVRDLGESARAVESDAWHISLSRTLVLRRPELANFVEALRHALRGCAAPLLHRRAPRLPARRAAATRPHAAPRAPGRTQRASGVRCGARSTGLCELTNDTRTRHFAAVRLRAAARGTPSAPAARGAPQPLAGGVTRGGERALTRGEGSADAFDALVDAVDAVAARFGGERFYDQRIPHFSVAWSLRSLAPQIASPAGDRASRAVGGHAVRCERVEVRIGERVTEFRLRT